jgi:hypothetical protein
MGKKIDIRKRAIERLMNDKVEALSHEKFERAVNKCMGLHEVPPELILCAADLIDPEIRQPIPLEEGAVGEGVLISLNRAEKPTF